jgi:outer membrane protein insertion porin family
MYSIISEALPSTKTSLKYIFKDDSRNDPILPTSGSLFHYSTEVAGLFGDVQFVKAEVSAQRHYGFGPNVFGNPILNLSFGSQFGKVFPHFSFDRSNDTIFFKKAR